MKSSDFAKRSIKTIAFSLMAAGLAGFLAVPAATVSAASIELRVVGAGSSASVDRKTDASFAIVLHGSPSGATKGAVTDTFGANLQFVAAASTPGASVRGNTITWTGVDFQPAADQVVTATFHVVETAPCGSTLTNSASAEGYGTAAATLTVTCGLGGGTGVVPGATSPAAQPAAQPATGATVITQPAATQPAAPTASQASEALTPDQDLTGGSAGSLPVAADAAGLDAPSALPNAGGEALPLAGAGGIGGAVTALGWLLRRRTA